MGTDATMDGTWHDDGKTTPAPTTIGMMRRCEAIASVEAIGLRRIGKEYSISSSWPKTHCRTCHCGGSFSPRLTMQVLGERGYTACTITDAKSSCEMSRDSIW